MKADYRLKCDGSEYDGYLGYTIFMICVYPIGIPLLYFVCLWSQRKAILGIKSADDVSNTVLNQLSRDSSCMTSFKLENDNNSSSLRKCKLDVVGRLTIEGACNDPITSPYSSLFGRTNLSSGTGSVLNV